MTCLPHITRGEEGAGVNDGFGTDITPKGIRENNVGACFSVAVRADAVWFSFAPALPQGERKPFFL